MRENLLSREQVIEELGITAVEDVEIENCEPTNAVSYNGKCQGDALTEWASSVHLTDKAGEITLRAYYYTDEDDENLAEESGCWDNTDWEIAGYEIV